MLKMRCAVFLPLLATAFIVTATPSTTRAAEPTATEETARAFGQKMAGILPKKLDRLSLISSKVTVQEITTGSGTVFVPIASQIYKSGKFTILHLAISYPTQTVLRRILKGRRWSRSTMVGMPLYLKRRYYYGRSRRNDPWARHALVAGDFVVFGRNLSVASSRLIAHLHELDYALLRKLQGGKRFIPKAAFSRKN